MFWSSLEVQAKQALNLSGLKAVEITIEPNKIYSVCDNEVYSTKGRLNFKEYGSRSTWNNVCLRIQRTMMLPTEEPSKMT